MRFWRKAISASVMAAVLWIPLMSLAACASESGSAMNCPPDCPMMTAGAVMQHGMEMSDASAACCSIQSSKPAPVPQTYTVPVVSALELKPIGFEIIATSKHSAPAADESSSPPGCDGQARLCTFLI